MSLISLKGKPLGQVTLLTAILTLLSPSASAWASLKSSPEPTLIAQEYACPPYSGGSQFVAAETPNFYIYICGGDLPNTYVGVAKNPQTGGIILPLQSFNNDQFVAVNGNVRYTLTRNQLIVTRQGRVIVRERANWLF
ncbi:hypothetical protein [Gloeothece citriformis]|nr:hypothetical protein [Gloeothece citriformis]